MTFPEYDDFRRVITSWWCSVRKAPVVKALWSLPSTIALSINAPSHCSQTGLDTERHFDKWGGGVSNFVCMCFSLIFNQVFSKKMFNIQFRALKFVNYIKT